MPAVLGGYPPWSRTFAACLCLLVALHVYWFVLIARIAIKSLCHGGFKDSRELDD